MNLGGGLALQANYAYRLFGREKAAVYGEVHFLANPLRDVDSNTRSVTRDVATLYVTPGVRLKLFPKSRVSPYFAVGGGYALYEQSTGLLNGVAKRRRRSRSSTLHLENLPNQLYFQVDGSSRYAFGRSFVLVLTLRRRFDLSHWHLFNDSPEHHGAFAFKLARALGNTPNAGFHKFVERMGQREIGEAATPRWTRLLAVFGSRASRAA